MSIMHCKVIGILILYLSILACSNSSSTPSSSYYITGRITNVTSYGGISVSVSSVSQSSNATKFKIAQSASDIQPDSNGEFSATLDPGCYQLTITKDGYRDRAIQMVCVDEDVPTKDLGDIGLSVERRFVMAASYGEKVVMAGGQNVDGNWTTVDILNTTTGQLTIENLAVKRARGVGVTLGSKGYFAGGEQCDASNVCVPSAIVDIYDFNNGQWTSGTLGVARADLTAAATTDGYAVFAGGWTTGGTVTNAVDVYDSNTDSWSTTTIPIGRFGMSSIAVGTKVYFAGGAIDSGGVNKSIRVDIFEPSTNTWTLKNMSVARRHFPTVQVGNKLLFAGGQTDCFPCGLSNVVDIYDIVGDSWTTASLSVGRELLVGASDGTVAVFVGGEAAPFNNVSDVADIFDSNTNIWSTATISEPRSNLAVTVLSGKVYFIGGNFDSQGFSNNIDIFDFLTKTFTNTLF